MSSTIPETKRQLLRQLLERRAYGAQATYPLSYGQQALWFIYKSAPESCAYNIAFPVRITSYINAEKLKHAFQKLINRHNSLRTTFTDRDGEPVQVVHGYQEVAFTEIMAVDLSEEELYQKVIEEYRRPFNLEEGPLLRVNLFTCSPQNYVLLITTHHIIIDFLSFVVINDELWQLYFNEKPYLAPLAENQYAEYVNWQKSVIEGAETESQWKYWRERLAGELSVLSLPLDYSRPPYQVFKGEAISFTIGNDLTQALKKSASKEGTTLFTLLLTVFQLFLHRYSGQDDILVGTPTNGRTRPEFLNMVGYLINMLAIRTDFKENPTFAKLLHQVRNTVYEALEHQDIPFMLLVDKLQPKRDPSCSPVFQVTFELLNYNTLSFFNDEVNNSISEWKKKSLKQYSIQQQEGQFDIMLTMVDMGGALTGTFNYNTGLFKRETVERMIEHFKILLHGIAENINMAIADLPFLTEQEIYDLLLGCNQTKAEYADESCLHQLFEYQAKRVPDAIAVSFGGTEISYGRLNGKANQIARLLRDQGVGRDDIIGVKTGRSIEFIIGILAVLKAGGAYLPIDPEYPEDRLKYIIGDSQTRIILTQKRYGAVDDFTGIQIYLDDEEIYQGDSSDLQSVNAATDLAYVIYTSGSTGKPKGAMVEHRGVVNYISWAIKQYGKDDKTGLNFPFYSSISFDLTVTSIFAPLLSGNRIEVYSDNDFVLDKVLGEDKVDIIKLTPSHLKALLNVDCSPKCLRSFIVGGEEFERALAEEVSKKFNGRVILYNEYGPTETVVGCMIHAFDQNKDNGRTVPIGVPSDNVKLYIFDQNRRLVPDSTIGELYIGGDGVCRGYLNRPELTSEKFIENPYIKGERVYRTGDLVRRRDGIIEFIGRVDQQVKLRGYRIECGEIEENLLKNINVQEVVVVIKEDANKEKFLCCYYVSATAVTGEMIRQVLSEKIPHYMIPSIYIQLEKMPLSQNGKIDRKHLQNKAIDIVMHEEYTAPRNQVEDHLIRIWKRVLKTEKEIGIYDNYYNLGGNSLLAIQMAQQLKKAGIDCKALTLLKYPTIAQLAEEIGKSTKVEGSCNQNAVLGEVELTPIQKWFFEKFGDPSHFNQYVILDVKQKIDEEKLKKAFELLLMHHDMLRACFIKKGSQWIQLIKEYVEHNILTIHDYTGLSTQDQDQRKRQIISESQLNFNLAEGPLIRAGYIKLGAGSGELLITIHHLITDFVSFNIIIEDLITIYDQLQQGLPLGLPEKTTSFKYWADSLTRYADINSFSNDVHYWCSEAMKNIQPIPGDYPDYFSDNREESVEQHVFSLNKMETEKIVKEIPRRHSFCDHEIILTCFVEALQHWTGRKSVMIDFESHGRQEIDAGIDLSRTVGWFTSSYPVVFDLNDNHSPIEKITDIKKQLAKVPNSGFNYGISKYLKKTKCLDSIPEPEIGFNYLGHIDNKSDNPIFDQKYFGLSSGKANNLPYLIHLNIVIFDNQMHLIIRYSNKMFKSATIQFLADNIRKHIGETIETLQDEKKDAIVLCSKCVLPGNFPKADINEQGVCSYCRSQSDIPVKKNEFKDEADLIISLEKYKSSNNKYHVLVPLSGGVDSSAALIDIVDKYKLKVLGFHNDHGYEDDIATNNVKKLCKALNVDLIIKQHDTLFMKKLWRYTNESKVRLSSCFVCGGILYANAIELADKLGIPLIINGYSKGQAMMMADKETALEYWEEMLEYFQRDEEFLAEFMRRQEPMSKQKVYLSREDLDADANQGIILVIPFYIFRFNKTDKEALKEKCRQVFDWQQIPTSYPGRTTNCRMVWLNTYMDLRRMKYTMYHEEYAGLVRKGELSRAQALSDLQFSPPAGVIERLAKEINLKW